jgi:hypothetical protein
VRLSRPRVLIRAGLLLVGGAFMLVKAYEARRAAGAVAPADAVLLSRIALVETLVGLLALVAAGIALLALRRRRRPHTLRLKDVERP